MSKLSAADVETLLQRVVAQKLGGSSFTSCNTSDEFRDCVVVGGATYGGLRLALLLPAASH